MSACRPIIVASAILVVVLVIASVIAKAQTSQANAQVILNLQNGQQYFGTPRVYQGDYNGRPTSQWPVYYEPSTASQYWGSPKINQPVLALVSAKHGVAGAMFWDETYIGGPVKITIIGTFSSGWPPGLFADGFVIYLFLKPTMWSVSPQYNYSVSYISAYRLWVINLYLGGDVIIPQSSTPCLIVQWDPFLRPGLVYSGQWNVVILSNIDGNNPSVVAGWNGIGTGSIYPNPGDRINVTVTYDPSTNTLSGVATDLNTGQSVSFTQSLSGYFTPPSSGNYVFGIGADTGGGYANWALLYVATTQQTTTPPTPPSSLIVQVPNLIPYLYNSSAMGAVYLNFTKAELGLFMPPVMLGNLSIPGILDFNNMSYFVHTLEGPYVFSTTLGGWNVYGFTFISLPTYGNGSVVNPTYMLQKTMVIAYNGGKVIALLYYRNLAPVSLELNQYWSHIHKGVDGLAFAVYPDSFNPYANATEQVIRDAYYIVGNTSLYVDGNYLGQLNSFGLWQVLPVGPITLINNAGGWYVQLIPMDNLSTTQQIQLVTNGFSINGVTIANSFFNIQHAEVTLMPDQSAQYVYSIGINTQPPNYTEISGILNYLLQIASSPKPHISSSLTVQVFNVLGRSATTVPGVVFGVLYNSNFKEVAFMNSSGYLNFNNINPGTYTLEVYHYPNTGLNLTEYWGGMTVSLQPGSNFVTFYRHEPWIYNLQASVINGEVVVAVTVNGTVASPTQGEIELWVANSPSSASPYGPSNVTYVTINPGINTFHFTYPVNQAGTYYVYAAVLTHISTYTVTDQWSWTPVQVPQLSNLVQVSTTGTTTATAPTTSTTTTSSTASARASNQAPQTTTAETVERAPTGTTTSEGEFVWIVKVSGNAFFWIFMMVVVVAIIMIKRR
ncbi:MAG: hypothetical protein RQ839_11300 [Thermoproteus sp.]|jgi:hypothetical protein|nr:hypothetical protein [Thermoproteus sp.]